MRNTYHKWTETELQYLRDNHTVLSDEEIANNLSKILNGNITTAMIRRQRRKLTLKKSRGRRPKNRVVTTDTTQVSSNES
jgi:hypothetical protein